MSNTVPGTVPTSGMVIRETTHLAPGVYLLPGGLRIAASGVTLDGHAATLVGENRHGVGIATEGLSHVTIRNVRLRDYYHGIAVRSAHDVTIENTQITATAEIAANTDFLDIWRPPADAYGGAIFLDHVDGGALHDNDLQHQFSGLLLYHCRHLDVRRNVASYNSGAGIYLFNTCDSVFEENWTDYCCRYQPRDGPRPVVGANSVGHMGADAAGFVIVWNSCRNIFRRNFARLGGDGFFLASRSPAGDAVGCDENVFEENDASLSPNIAFEATFSSGNVFRNNCADRSNYGFWLGYSSRNVLEGNRLLLNRQAGVAAEHAVDMEVRRNDFQGNGHGVLLWTSYSEELSAALPASRTLRNWVIEHNRFYRNDFGLAIRADRDHGIRPLAPALSGRAELRPADITIRDNDIQDNRVGIHLCGTDRVVIERNKINRNVEADLRREDDRDTMLGHNLGLRGAYL